MSFKVFTFLVLALMVVQLFVIIGITRASRDAVADRPAAEYGQWMRELAVSRPRAAMTIKICWGLWMVELFAVWLAKHVIFAAA